MEHEKGKSITDRTISGLNWNFLRNYGKAIISTIIGIILARLIPPQDFGLLGMTLIFTGLADLFATLGMGSSIVRIKHLTIAHIRTGTTVTILSSILIYLTFWFLAPMVADFYNDGRIIPILRTISILFIIKGLTTVSFGQLTKNLDFKYILIIELGSYTVGYALISSVLALLGFGVWSLVYGRLASSIFSLMLTIRKVPINFKVMFGKKEFKDLAGFGSGVTLSNLLLYASSNIDFLIIGKFLNPFMLGLYTRAFNLMTESISKVTGGMYSVLFPAFALVQNETDKLRKAYYRTIKTVSFFIFPIFGAMIVNADYVIKGLYGERWSGAIDAFRILAVGGILRTSLSYSGAIAHATGKVYSEAFQQLLYLIILGGSALYAVKYGITGVAFAVLFAIICMFTAQSWLAIKITKSSWKEFFNSLKPGIINMAFMIILNFILAYFLETYTSAGNEIKLLIMVIYNIISFIFLIIFVPSKMKGDTFDWVLQKYKNILPSNIVKIYLAFNNQRL